MILCHFINREIDDFGINSIKQTYLLSSVKQYLKLGLKYCICEQSNNYNLKIYLCQTAKNVNHSHTPLILIPTCDNKAPLLKLLFCSKKIMHNISKICTAAKKTSALAYNSIEYHTRTNSLRNV